MKSSRSIPDLLDAADSPDLAVAGGACRELLTRSAECHDDIPRVIDLLENSNAAIADYAFRTLERIGQPAVDPLMATYGKTQGEVRKTFLGLITGIAQFSVYFPLVRSEIRNGEPECRFWAACCLARNYNDHVDWPPHAIELLDDAVEILISLQNQPEYWAQARMTLKHLGKRPDAS